MERNPRILLVNLCVLFGLLYISDATFTEENYKSKYEYKYSFKGPSLSQPGKGIPFWNHSFDAFPGEDQVRVVPSLRNKVGAVWSKYPFESDEWKVEISFRVHGRGRIGADGFVLWYVETPNVHGSVFGSMDNWKGLGLFFDSYDNDGKKNNPYISVLVNNGSISYSHDTDGIDQMQGGCLRDFRDRPYPVKARIIYTEKQLEVYISPGNIGTDDYDRCTVVNDVDLPKGYYFGISAATGALADDHDILKFMTWSLNKKDPEAKPDAVDEEAKKIMEEQKRLEEEYEKNLQDFYSEQKKFKEEHPDKAKPDYGSPEDLFQGDSSAELRAVFEVQTKIKEQVNDLTKTIVKIMEKQDVIVSKIEQNQPSDVEVAKSHEIENVVKLQRSTHDTISELKNHINYLKSTSDVLVQSASKLGSNTGAVDANSGNPYETKQQLDEVAKKLDSIYLGVSTIENKQRNQPRLACPEPDIPSCVSSVVLIAVAALQVIILLAYHSFKQSREDAAKKFF